MSSKLTTKEFIDRSREIHGDKFDYSKSVYVDAQTKITIICPVHGELRLKSNSHWSYDCKLCQHDLQRIRYEKYRSINMIDSFVKIHGNKYDYTEVDTTAKSKDKITIICPIHGKFIQSVYKHKSGHGCVKCYHEEHCGYICNAYFKRLPQMKDKPAILYKIRCWNETENFYKVGITTRTIKERFKGNRNMPYNFQVIDIIHGTLYECWKLESQIHRLNKIMKYTPNFAFGGVNECYKANIKISELVTREQIMSGER